jgi:opacity protein-like surface antigen
MAGAADMPWGRGPAVISERGPAEVEIGTGWYLRGDIGFSRATAPSMTLGATSFTGVGRDGAFVYGGGFGYKFNEWLRADLTVDQISSYGLKHRIGSVGCFGVDTCTVDQKFDGKVVPVLANAYLDLGKWWGFTPYVGGGAGVARMRTGGVFAYTDTKIGRAHV